MRRVFLAFGFWLLAIGLYAAIVKSPNGNIELTFTVDETGRPVYEMSYKGKDVVKPSYLGLELAKDKHASAGLKERDLMNGFTIIDEQTRTFDETWKPVWGETATIRNHYNELAVTLEQRWREPVPSPRKGMQLQPRLHRREMIIRFRVYDDGIGFRYEFPQQPDLNYFLIQEERSEFAMAGDHIAWRARPSLRRSATNCLPPQNMARF